jgi:hypothetical protein
MEKKVNKIVEQYRKSSFESPYVFVEESENELVKEVLYKGNSMRKLSEMYNMGADKNSVEDQVQNEEKEFNVEYNEYEENVAKLSFALIEVIQNKTD